MFVRMIYMKHEGGTKFYRIFVIAKSADNSAPATLIFNFGGVAQSGNFTHEGSSKTYPLVSINNSANRQRIMKERRGYSVVSDVSGDLSSPETAQLFREISSLRARSGKFNAMLSEAAKLCGIDSGSGPLTSVPSSTAEPQLTPAQIRKALEEERLSKVPAGWGDW